MSISTSQDKPSFEDVLALAAEYPNHITVSFGAEPSKGPGWTFVAIHEEAPPGGWTSQGMYRRTSAFWSTPVHPDDRHDRALRASVSADNAAECARDAYAMLRKHRHDFDVYPPTPESA